MAHLHKPSPHSDSSDDAQHPNTIKTSDSLDSHHARKLPAAPEFPQATPGSHNPKTIAIDILEAGTSTFVTPTNPTLSTSMPALSHECRQQNLSSGPQVPGIPYKCKTIPHIQTTGSPPAPDRKIEPQQPSMMLDDASGFWERFNQAANFEDREFIKDSERRLDTILVFAGMFSCVITAFILESMKTIQPDQAQMTNALIRSVIMVLQNTTVGHTFHDEPFIPAHQHVRCTIIFFTSLCCSLSAIFVAVLGKQWLDDYERNFKPPPGRGRERQKKYEGRSHWHMEGIIKTLPTILQISIFLFLVALVDFTFPVNIKVAYVVMGFSSALALFYVITTTIATIHPHSPFQTILSTTIRSIQRSPRYLILTDMLKHPCVDLGNIMIRLLDWLEDEHPVKQFGYVFPIITIPFTLPLCFLWRVVTLLPSGLWSLIIEGTTLPDTILDLKCLIFYAERASGSDALAYVIEAIGTLPPDLEVDRNHPIITSFCEMLFTFVIQPTSSATVAHEYTSKLTNGDFRQLLKALRFLYTAWLRSDHPFQNTQVNQYLNIHRRLTIKEVCKIFSQEPKNVSTTSLIADILEVASTISGESTGIDQALLWKHLQSPALQDADSLPYISLLFTESINQLLSNPMETEALVRRLRSTMWINDQPDLNYTRSGIRAHVLSEYVGESEHDFRFSLYLTICCKHCLAVEELAPSTSLVMSQSLVACNHYLTAIFWLLHRGKGTLWPQRFETDGFPSLLMRLFQPFLGHNIHARALLCFVLLWYRRRGSKTPETTLDDTFKSYLTPHAVERVAATLKYLDWVNYSGRPHYRMKSPQVALALTPIAEYFEAASRLGLLKLGMISIVDDFRDLAQRYPLPTRQLNDQLQGRMNTLIFS